MPHAILSGRAEIASGFGSGLRACPRHVSGCASNAPSLTGKAVRTDDTDA